MLNRLLASFVKFFTNKRKAWREKEEKMCLIERYSYNWNENESRVDIICEVEKEEKVICRFDPEGISKALFDSLKDRRRFL